MITGGAAGKKCVMVNEKGNANQAVTCEDSGSIPPMVRSSGRFYVHTPQQ